jgi:hypothetical protein
MTETALERVLADPATSGSVVLITPEVEKSDVIRKVEAPRIFARAAAADGFFAIPVAAGGLDYGDLARVLGPGLGLTEIAGFNVMKSRADPFDAAFASEVGQRTLRERLGAVNRALGPGEPVTLQVATRAALPKATGFSLRADLTHRFAGRTAEPGAWESHLLPAFSSIAAEMARTAIGRRLNVSGYPSLAVALALGAALPSLGPVRAAWIQEQVKFGAAAELWSLDGPDKESGFGTEVRPLSASCDDLALLVSATNDVVADFSVSRTGLPLRAAIHLAPRGERPARLQLSAAQARNLACVAVDALRGAVQKYSARGTIHLFLAVPAGVAFMIGQQMNTFGRVQTYEHDPAGTPPYTPAVMLTPSC